jgi:hypothetical protein
VARRGQQASRHPADRRHGQSDPGQFSLGQASRVLVSPVRPSLVPVTRADNPHGRPCGLAHRSPAHPSLAHRSPAQRSLANPGLAISGLTTGRPTTRQLAIPMARRAPGAYQR